MTKNTSDTLVIHPIDYTTDFLSEIYDGKGWDVISNPQLRPVDLCEAISAHERIIMLGHGTPQGLLGERGYMIDKRLVPLLREKRIVAIWCHANQFIERYRLNAFYSGMFISEVVEARFEGIYDVDEETVETSNYLFSTTLGKHIDSGNVLESVKNEYIGKDSVTKFNRDRLYENNC